MAPRGFPCLGGEDLVPLGGEARTLVCFLDLEFSHQKHTYQYMYKVVFLHKTTRVVQWFQANPVF